MKPILIAMLMVVGCMFAASGSFPGGTEKSPERTSDVIYGRKDGLALTLDVFRPTGKANGAALVMIVSGGYRSSPDDILPPVATEFLKRGYVCFAVVHGSQPRYTVPEIQKDINRAVRFVRHHAKKYSIDPNRIGTLGASSGGLLALLLSTAPMPANADAKDPVDRVASNVQAVVAFFPPTDYLNYGGQGKEFTDVKMHGIPYRAAHDFREFDAKEGLFQTITDKDKLRAVYKNISPIYHVTAKTAPTLLFHGDKDDLVPFQQSESYLAKLKAAGVPAQLEVRKGAGHGWLTLLSEMRLAADWFDTHLKAPAK